MTDRNAPYTIISSDTHCGPQAGEYRQWLPEKHHAAFDEYLAEREAHRQQALDMNFEYIMGWETENEEGLRGAYDPEARDKEIDADGVAAEVMFRPTPMPSRATRHPRSAPASPPVRSTTRSSPSPAPGPTTASWPSCAATRRSDAAASASSPSATASRSPSPRSSGWPNSPASAAS